MTYNHKKIARELYETAVGDCYHGNALRVAKDFAVCTAEDRALLDRWAIGRQSGLSDCTDLQDLALRIEESNGKVADERQDCSKNLRDQFAGLAMLGEIISQGLEGRDAEAIAGMAFEMADAMLAMREAKGGAA